MGGVTRREQLRRLRRFLPPPVMKLVATRSERELLAFEQREITVVFCDLRGFTAFAQAAPSAEIVDVLSAFHRAIGPVIVDEDGILERFTGDGVMVYFDGAPLCEQAQRAVRMAVRIRDAVSALARQWRRRGHALSVGIGLAAGHATLGPIGFEQRRDYAAIGPVTNLASRLCAAAGPGQVLMSDQFQDILRDVIDAEPLGPRRLKGFDVRVSVYSVRALRGGCASCTHHHQRPSRVCKQPSRRPIDCVVIHDNRVPGSSGHRCPWLRSPAGPRLGATTLIDRDGTF
jgi:class 3 adenylate cyclase